MIKMPNISHEPPSSSKSPNHNIKDMDVLCTFRILIESLTVEHTCMKDNQPYANQDQDAKPWSGTSKCPKWGHNGHKYIGVSNTSNHIQIMIKMPKPGQEYPASSKAPNEDLKDMDVLCTFKIKIESQNSDLWYIKDHWPYPSQDQDANPKSGVLCTSEVKIDS